MTERVSLRTRKSYNTVSNRRRIVKTPCQSLALQDCVHLGMVAVASQEGYELAWEEEVTITYSQQKERRRSVNREARIEGNVKLQESQLRSSGESHCYRPMHEDNKQNKRLLVIIAL